jgi:GT2 family glycosyltransferase
MDDFPAGPASPGPRRPSLSVVIPVHNGGIDLERCLRRLRESRGISFELIVVDDASTDGSAALSESWGARVLRHESRQGPAAARNVGARVASCALVFFLDADVAVHPETLARAAARFEADPGLAALFGSYDAEPEAPGLVSGFRNLLHHYVHQQGDFVDDARPARSFWTGCGAIRRQVFLDLGGFDPGLYRRPAIEDIELGYRMTRAGHRVVLARDVLATHLKRWSLGDVLRTDIFRRGVPWMLLIKRSRIDETDLNVGRGQKLSVAATGITNLALLASPLSPPLMLAIASFGLAVMVALNRNFYRFLASRRGWAFAIASVPLHNLYFSCCGLSVVIALALWHAPRRCHSDTGPSDPIGASRRGDRAGRAASPRPFTAKARRRTRWTRP